MGSVKMNGSVFALVPVLLIAVSACSSHSGDSCDDLEGTITHTVTEITGVESVSVLKRNPNDNVVEATDGITGVEFSNLSIDIKLSWIEEQHRFRQPSTFIQSALAWFISPAMACTLAPYYEDYQPAVTSIEIYSDSDFNDEFIAGTELGTIFTTVQINGDSSSNLSEALVNGDLLSARSYSLQPAWPSGVLTSAPETPNTHTFTIMLSVDDGRTFEMRTPAVLISGV